MARDKRNSVPMRTHPEFEKIVKEVMANNLMKGKTVPSSRITLAMSRQYKKYPYLFSELKDAKLP